MFRFETAKCIFMFAMSIFRMVLSFGVVFLMTCCL